MGGPRLPHGACGLAAGHSPIRGEDGVFIDPSIMIQPFVTMVLAVPACIDSADWRDFTCRTRSTMGRWVDGSLPAPQALGSMLSEFTDACCGLSAVQSADLMLASRPAVTWRQPPHHATAAPPPLATTLLPLVGPGVYSCAAASPVSSLTEGSPTPHTARVLTPDSPPPTVASWGLRGWGGNQPRSAPEAMEHPPSGSWRCDTQGSTRLVHPTGLN